MAGTITYKGNTIASVTNGGTKTLLTQGKYLEGNVIVTDTTSAGTAGTPVATKGTVSNNSVTVTPSVTNTTGWITGSTLTGTPVAVSASELVSGTLSIDDDGTYDVTNYASADVAIDYESKVRKITFNLSRQDATSAMLISFLQTFGSSIDFSSSISTPVNTSMVAIGETTGSKILYVPKSRPAIIVWVGKVYGNFTVNINSSYGVCYDAPRVLGSSNSYYKVIYLKSAAPDEFSIDLVMGSSDPYPDAVLLDTLTATSNTTYTAPAGTAYNSVTVAVPAPTPSLQSKTATPTESQQSITADSGYDGLSDVTVNAISSTYVGSGIDRRDSTDLTASGATVTVPAGYYENQASKAVSSGSATPAVTISGSSAAITTSANSITLSKTVSNTPVVSPGYISSGTAGNSDVSLTASVTVDPTPTASGKTVTTPAGYYTTSTTTDVATGSATPAASISGTSATISTGTNTITLSKTVSNTPTVSAGYISSGTAGNSDVSLTASVTTKAAQTYTPGTTDQTISANQYLTGAQTIAGDADLVAGNIKSGVQIFGVTGSYTSDATAAAADIVDGETAYVNGNKVTGSLVINKYYTGSASPSSSLGANGDIYFQV